MTTKLVKKYNSQYKRFKQKKFQKI